MNRGGRIEPTPPECALAAEMFDHFCAAGTMKQILALHREICSTLNLKPNRLPDFYPKLKNKLASSWKAQALFKKFDARSNHKVYLKGRACTHSKVLIIGAGPCGLRAAIECQLLGAKVVVIEKRDRVSRNNVLHLWPFVIHDLRALGAKKFFGKFCAGSIDHISIRQLQCILLKVSLLLGVEFHEGVSFEELLEPNVTENSEVLGWRARVLPLEHPVSHYEFDVLIGADGKRNTLHGFKRKEFRGKLAMAITANFINRHTEQEASVPEISGVAFIFNQKFFKELYAVTGIDLENIVYYKDDTHYFVMTAKKHSLLDKGVLLNDYAEVSRLLSVENVDRGALMRYAQEAARFSTDSRLPLRDFALNHYGEPDVALFDFTSMYAAENASMVYERNGRRLLCQLVGDSLLEPFWPTGSGCARGFLSALDASWAVRTWAQSPTSHPMEVIAERESIYRLLAQTTPENLQRDFGAYTLDPGTRYPNLNRTAVTAHRVSSFFDSDDPLPLDAVPSAKKRRRETEISEEALVTWVGWSEPGLRAAVSSAALTELLRRYRPDLLPENGTPRAVYHVLHHEFGIPPFSSNGSSRDVADNKLRSYLARVYSAFKGEVPHVHHTSHEFDKIKESIQKEKHKEHSLSMYKSVPDTEKSHSSYRRKRRSVRTPQVSNDPEEYIRNKIGKLDLNDITQLARLIDGHDAFEGDDNGADKQRMLQEQILALLDSDESPDPAILKESLSQLLQGSSKTSVNAIDNCQIANFFENRNIELMSTKPSRKLKGLDINSIKIPDFSDVFESYPPNSDIIYDTCAPKNNARSSSTDRTKPKLLTRTSSTESPQLRHRKFAEVFNGHRNKFSQSPELDIRPGRSHSVGSTEMAIKRMTDKTKQMAELFEDNKRRHAASPESRSARSGSVSTPEMALRLQRMTEIIEGKRRDTPSPDRSKRSECIGSPEMALRRQRVADLIEGNKSRNNSDQIPKAATSDMALRLQRVSDMMEKRNAEHKRPKSGGKRKAAREIMRQRFEKSIQMLAAEPRLDFTTSADLENDYGLQQYRASAPQFDERVKKLEKKLQHYEEGRVVGGGGRSGVGGVGGVRVAQLAAELAGTTSAATPRASKPKDLMRSVGKIERDDWNVKEIERKIKENRLGRPEPKTAEKVPKWDREQFLVRQKRLKEGEPNEKWGEIDKTLNKLDQKLRDSGRPDHGTRKVAHLATKFVKNDESKSKPEETRPEECKKSWRGPSSAGMQCAACGTRVFAAEGVTADGLHLHRACFRCAVCKTVLRPGNYTMERYGNRLVCLRHSGVAAGVAASLAGAGGVTVADAGSPADLPSMPERISLEVSDSAAREIDEDEWTDRNFLPSETSCAGGLSDEEESSSDEYMDMMDSDNEAEHSPEPEGVAEPRPPRSELYFSDDSFGYDDFSDDGGESSGNESCSRMREAREARRREVPADARPPTDSSEVESEEESESSDEEVSSATEVSTDSEFAHEDSILAPTPPAILVTEAPLPAPSVEYPLSRTRSAGGIAIKRALELKRKYLLGEASPPAVRKSESASQLDTKLEAFRSSITEFQKMLHPAPTVTTQIPRPTVAFQFSTDFSRPQPMPDIIQNLCNDAPLDLLAKSEFSIINNDWKEEVQDKEEKKEEPELDSDSLSEEDSSHTDTAPNQANVPRLEVHDEGGELIQLDSLTLVSSTTTENVDEKISGTITTTGPTVVAADSDSSESCRDATTLALTETELSDWAAESAVLDDCGFEDKNEGNRNKDPHTLSGLKNVHDAKNISTISTHVCGRVSPAENVVYSNALEHFEFVDEGDQDPSIETPVTLRNEGYMELVDDELCSQTNDRSINFIERNCTDIVMSPVSNCLIENKCNDTVVTSVNSDCTEDKRTEAEVEPKINNNISQFDDIDFPNIDDVVDEVKEVKCESDLKSPKLLKQIDSEVNDSISTTNTYCGSSVRNEYTSVADETMEESANVTPVPPLLLEDKTELSDSIASITLHEKTSPEVTSPPLIPETPKALKHSMCLMYPIQNSISIRIYSPAICRSASETFHRSNSRSTNSTGRSELLINSVNLSSGSMSPVSPPPRETTDKVQEIKREREEQTEVVRRLVLERLGNGPRGKKLARRVRASPCSCIPPPVPPPPSLPAPLSLPAPPSPPPPRPEPPTMPLSVTPSFSNPELAAERRGKSIMKSISSYLNRRLGPRHKDSSQQAQSTSALQAPPVPPPPARYSPPALVTGRACNDVDERDAMQLWFESRWARLVAQRRARGEPRLEGLEPRAELASRRLARLERRLSRPLSAEQQAATVAELMQVSAQRNAHQALIAANRRRSAGGGVCD